MNIKHLSKSNYTAVLIESNTCNSYYQHGNDI